MRSASNPYDQGMYTDMERQTDAFITPPALWDGRETLPGGSVWCMAGV
jgi:hypothetical protein